MQTDELPFGRLLAA